MKTKKPKSNDRYIVLVAKSKTDMAKGLYSMCRFRADDVLLFSNGRPVVPTLFKTLEAAKQKVGVQKMYLAYERYDLDESIKHLKQYGFVEEYHGIIDFVKKTAVKKHGLLGTFSPVFKIAKTTQEKWDNLWKQKGER